MSEVNDWNATDASNTTLGSISLVEGVTTIDQYNDIARAIMGANKRQLGAVNIATTIASAATTDLNSTTGWVVAVTGTTTITAFGTATAGTVKILRFAGILTLTYHATNLILPGAASIVTAANDVAVFVSLGAGSWYCANYQRQAQGPTQGWELIASGTPSAVGQVDITDLSAYRTLKMTGKLRPATDNVILVAQTSTDNGSLFTSSGYAMQAAYVKSATFTGFAGSGAVHEIAGTGDGIGNLTTEGCSFVMYLYDFNKSVYCHFISDATIVNPSAAVVRNFSGAVLQNATARNALRVKFDAGTITSGYYTLEGVRG